MQSPPCQWIFAFFIYNLLIQKWFNCSFTIDVVIFLLISMKSHKLVFLVLWDVELGAPTLASHMFKKIYVEIKKETIPNDHTH